VGKPRDRSGRPAHSSPPPVSSTSPAVKPTAPATSAPKALAPKQQPSVDSSSKASHSAAGALPAWGTGESIVDKIRKKEEAERLAALTAESSSPELVAPSAAEPSAEPTPEPTKVIAFWNCGIIR
jgi:hypothetical protein